MTPETLHPCAHRIALTYPFTPGALRIVAGEFDGGFRQRQKQGVAKGAIRLAEDA
jgi:hypothetical protein